MKEVKFRTIDKLFIKMSINDKVWILFVLFLVAIGSIAGKGLYSQLQQIESRAIEIAHQRLDAIIHAVTVNSIENQVDISKVERVSEPRYKNGVATVSKKALMVRFTNSHLIIKHRIVKHAPELYMI